MYLIEEINVGRSFHFLNVHSLEWNTSYPNSIQQALPNTSSDHCPILYTAKTGFRVSKFFRFENFWLRLPQFKEMVTQKWESSPTATDPTKLDKKFKELQSEIKAWVQDRVGAIKTQITVCRQYLGWMDKAKECRPQTQLEKFITCLVKKRFTDLSTMEEDLWRQRARTNWELNRDKSTRFFHALASKSKSQNSIPFIEHRGNMHSGQKAKADAFFEFYRDLMGHESQPTPHINWSNLYTEQLELQELASPITIEEVNCAIKSWPNNKSPGPDSFTGEFYKVFSQILIPDIMAIMDSVTNRNSPLAPLNTSYIILIPQKDHPLTLSDYRPISLIHAIQRIFSKILANRLQGRVQEMVDASQTGFIKNRQIT